MFYTVHLKGGVSALWIVVGLLAERQFSHENLHDSSFCVCVCCWGAAAAMCMHAEKCSSPVFIAGRQDTSDSGHTDVPSTHLSAVAGAGS